MSRNEARRQKKLAKRKKDRQQRRTQLHKAGTLSNAALLRKFDSGTIVDAFIAESIYDSGLGEVAIVRQANPGHVAFAVFLVDRYCLGVKNVLSGVITRSRFEELTSPIQERGVMDAPPATCRKLVEDAVAYARNFGFQPHADYAAGRMIFGDINPADADETFEMGRDGKPFYMNGPLESPARVRAILQMLEQRCGPGGYHFTCGLDQMPGGPHFALTDFEGVDDGAYDDSDDDFADDEAENDGGPALLNGPALPDDDPPPRLFWD